jgi:hypothetical protein
MKLTREEILAIAKKHCMEYVHETYLMRFVEQLVETNAQQLEANGYDDAANAYVTKYDLEYEIAACPSLMDKIKRISFCFEP